MKILLPVDGSKHSLNAVRYVAERLWPSLEDAEIILLHVHYRVPPRAASAVGRTVVEGYYQSEAEAAQKGARKLLDQHGIPYNALRQPGYPGKVIPEYAESMGADLVVMGSHGLGAAKGLLLGSVTQAVIANCKTPLLVIRDGQLPPEKGEVLVAVDGSAYTRRAVAYLLRHRAQFASQGRITLMHVSPPPGRMLTAVDRILEGQRHADNEKAMRPAQRLLDKVGLKYKMLNVTGDPGERIANHARGNHAGLIVMGSHGRGSMTSLLLGSVTQKTLAGARAPVLIVR
jgi:nucleotide-binding universal stress UspA family protein